MSETISIDLSTELADLVRHQVETGVFASQSAVVEEALRLLHDRAERLAALKASLDEAAEDREPIPAAKLRKHFEQRFAALATK